MAQTLAELLVKIKTDGVQQVKRDLRDIEDALRKANAASERNIRSFERNQSRIIAGQKRMLTSGGTGGGASSMGIDAKALDEVTQALKDMAGPLNSVIDGATQVMQVFSIGSVRASANVEKLRGNLRLIEREAGGLERMMMALELKAVEREQGPLSSLARSGAGFASAEDLEKTIRQYEAYQTTTKRIAIEEQRALPMHERFWGMITKSMAGLSVGGALSVGAVAGIAAITASIAGMSLKMYEFMLNSREAGRNFQDMQTRLKAMALGDRSMGSRGVMADITGSSVSDLALARSQAGPSRFTTKQMTDQIVQLRAFGLNANRILPLIAKVGQAFGANEQDLSMYTNAFGQLAGGQMPDVQVLNKMGITKQQLQARGVKFDKGGGLLSSTETVMVAMEKIINGKFGKIFELTKDDASSMAASLQDSFDGIQQKVGLATEKGLKPFYQALVGILGVVEQGSFLEAFTNDMIAPITELGGIMLNAKEIVIGFAAAFAAAMATMVHSLGRLPRGLSKVFGSGRSMKERLGGLYDIAGTVVPGVAAQDDAAYFTSKTQEYMYRMLDTGAMAGVQSKKGLKDPFGGIKPFGGGGDGSDGTKTKRTLEKIESNTRKSAELLDLRRQTIGGGEIAALGVTGAEIAGMGLKNRSEITLRSPIRPDTQVIRGIKDLVYGNMNFAIQGSPINRVRF